MRYTRKDYKIQLSSPEPTHRPTVQIMFVAAALQMEVQSPPVSHQAPRSAIHAQGALRERAPRARRVCTPRLQLDSQQDQTRSPAAQPTPRGGGAPTLQSAPSGCALRRASPADVGPRATSSRVHRCPPACGPSCGRGWGQEGLVVPEEGRVLCASARRENPRGPSGW